MSNTTLDTKVLQLMASKICHDLISPIGAIGNGVEFIEDMGADAIDDAVPLIKHSSTQASAKLRAYRIAYGAGGADGHVKPEDVYNAINDIVTGDGRITQDWDPAQDMAVPEDHYERPQAYCKILICALLQALDCLPKGGTLSVDVQGNETHIIANGENAGFREEIIESLSLTLNNDILEPKHAHAVLTGLLVNEYDYKISAETTENTAIIKITHPAYTPIT